MHPLNRARRRNASRMNVRTGGIRRNYTKAQVAPLGPYPVLHQSKQVAITAEMGLALPDTLVTALPLC